MADRLMAVSSSVPLMSEAEYVAGELDSTQVRIPVWCGAGCGQVCWDGTLDELARRGSPACLLCRGVSGAGGGGGWVGRGGGEQGGALGWGAPVWGLGGSRKRPSRLRQHQLSLLYSFTAAAPPQPKRSDAYLRSSIPISPFLHAHHVHRPGVQYLYRKLRKCLEADLERSWESEVAKDYMRKVVEDGMRAACIRVMNNALRLHEQNLKSGVCDSLGGRVPLEWAIFTQTQVSCWRGSDCAKRRGADPHLPIFR